MTGSVTFDCDILGLVIFTDGLNVSDSILGASSTLYPTSELSRGIIVEGGDIVTLTADRRTLELSLGTANRLDSLRTITSEPTLLGDVNLDGVVDFFDLDLFVSVLTSLTFQDEADINRDGVVNFFDITPFIGILSNT